LSLDHAAQTFVFEEVAQLSCSLNRIFGADQADSQFTAEDLRFLAARDGYPPQPLASGVFTAIRVLTDNVAALRAGGAARPTAASSMHSARSRRREPGRRIRRARATLPGEADIAREIGRDVDPDAVFTARKPARRGRCTARCSAQRTLPPLDGGGSYQPDAEGAGRRACATLVDLLAARARDGVALGAGQYAGADNMTDRVAALSMPHDVPERTAAFDFYARYSDDPLTSTSGSRCRQRSRIPQRSRVRRSPHAAFSMQTGICARADRCFRDAEPARVHRADGAGYDFLVKTVFALDPMNPQVAARLLSALKSWRVLEPSWCARAEAALAGIGRNSDLTRCSRYRRPRPGAVLARRAHSRPFGLHDRREATVST
jgi:aminopeptidase N